jgi:hypothetical protein
MRRIIFLFLCVFLVSCEQQFDAEDISEVQCKSLNGKWDRTMAGGYICNLPTSDGGVECVDSRECESSCNLDVEISELESLESEEVVGNCSEWQSSAYLGCWVTVEDGNAVGICV